MPIERIAFNPDNSLECYYQTKNTGIEGELAIGNLSGVSPIDKTGFLRHWGDGRDKEFLVSTLKNYSNS
jgi:hypothetical protein